MSKALADGAIAGILSLGALFPGLVVGEDKVSTMTDMARSSGLMLEAGKPDRLNFNFDNQVTAWLLPNGEWHVQGYVSHLGLLCGTYQVGLRFGAGNPGCSEVEWLTEPSYVTRELQCNNGRVIHSGGDQQPVLAEKYTRISCAERLILCSGNCK
jgi:hypothetical protein